MKILKKWALISITLAFVILNVGFYCERSYFIHKSFSEVQNIKPKIENFMLEHTSETERICSLVYEKNIVIYFNDQTRILSVNIQGKNKNDETLLDKSEQAKIIELVESMPFKVTCISPSEIHIFVPADGCKYERFTMYLTNNNMHDSYDSEVGEFDIALPNGWSVLLSNRDPAIIKSACNIWAKSTRVY